MHPHHATAKDLAAYEKGWEIVNGELVQKASPTLAHGGLQLAFGTALVPYRGRGGQEKPGGWLFGSEVEIEFETHQVFLPDLAGWRLERAPTAGNVRPVRVVPDWVCEILSPSTAQRDLGPKQQAYHRARVGHYWIVDPVAEHTLQVLRWNEDDYRLVQTAPLGGVIHAEPFDAVEIEISDSFNPGS